MYIPLFQFCIDYITNQLCLGEALLVCLVGLSHWGTSDPLKNILKILRNILQIHILHFVMKIGTINPFGEENWYILNIILEKYLFVTFSV